MAEVKADKWRILHLGQKMAFYPKDSAGEGAKKGTELSMAFKSWEKRDSRRDRWEERPGVTWHPPS
jgi:hypothetical protein